MARYRYRTATLVGRWRATRAEAEEDAIARRQAKRSGQDRLAWIVPGEIEEKD